MLQSLFQPDDGNGDDDEDDDGGDDGNGGVDNDEDPRMTIFVEMAFAIITICVTYILY